MTVTPEWCAMMARYNSWQNQSIFGAADGLDADAREANRGAFFGSIRSTLSHLLWGDLMWISRFDGGVAPQGGIPDSAETFDDWAALKSRRQDTDTRIRRWAEGVDADSLHGDLTWYSGAVGRELTRPFGICVAHFFNHQTHHRGQVHAMLTAAGAKPDDTDLILMPEDS